MAPIDNRRTIIGELKFLYGDLQEEASGVRAKLVRSSIDGDPRDAHYRRGLLRQLQSANKMMGAVAEQLDELESSVELERSARRPLATTTAATADHVGAAARVSALTSDNDVTMNFDGGADCGPGPGQLSQFAKHLRDGDAFLQDRPDFYASLNLSGQEELRFPVINSNLEAMLSRAGPAQMNGHEAEFEAAFARGTADAELEHAFNQAMTLSDRGQNGDWAAEFAQHAPQVEATPTHFDEAFEREWSEQFNSVTSSLDTKGKGKLNEIPTTEADAERLLENWKAEFEKTGGVESAEALVDDGDWKRFGELWKGMSAEGGEAHPWLDDFEDFAANGRDSLLDPDPVTGPLAPYVFERDNPFLEHADPMAEGLRIVQSGGTLSEAALAFEAAVQRDPNNSEAWMHLGHVQAENEKEGPAIAALQRSVQENPDNLPALMSLAISYTNESMEVQAYSTLERWLRSKYPSVAEPESTVLSTGEMHERVTRQFLAAVKTGPAAAAVGPVPAGGALDPDVQIGLGVLFYIRNDYEKAIDCFHSALSSRPSDYLLWNRLGATLANSGRSEEAIDAYYKALELKPTFVRCRYNLGVSCINIGCYREAAEHLLGALSMHVVGGDTGGRNQANVSENLWETLRRTFIQMERRDLADLTYGDRNLDQFRKEFDF
ncbi:Peroxisomal membrane signal receptor PTS1 [Cladochytrium tenue]|nr:Peroxisomal membrane signal receptor PTS1 [Cladochytrium tenue]